MQDFGIDPSFGQLVEQEMKRRGDTRAVAAAAMDISTSMLSDLLTGQPRNYSMTSLKKICEYAHLSADQVLGLAKPSDEADMLHMVHYATGLSPKAIEMLGRYNRSDWALETNHAEDFAKLEQVATNRLLEDEGTYSLLSLLQLYFMKMDQARQDVKPTDDALIDAMGFVSKYGFTVVTALAAAKHQRHITSDAFVELIKRLSGETDYKKPDGMEYHDLLEPWGD